MTTQDAERLHQLRNLVHRCITLGQPDSHLLAPGDVSFLLRIIREQEAVIHQQSLLLDPPPQPIREGK